LHTRCLKFSFDNTVTWHSKHASKRNLKKKLNARHLGTWICWLLIDSCFHSFITACWKHWRQWTAFVHSYQNHVDKQWLTILVVGSIPP